MLHGACFRRVAISHPTLGNLHMTFKIPSPLQYLISLIIAAIFASIALWIMGAQGFDSKPAMVLAVGLLIGHLIGVCATPSKSQASTSNTSTRTTSDNQSPANADSDTTSGSEDTISLYVGNLAYSAQREALHDLFTEYGQVNSVRIMTDRATRRPRGYGFVEMETSAARKALNALDGTEFCDRTLRVSEAKQRG